MARVSYGELRANLPSYLDRVCDGDGPLYVNRRNRRSVVLISEADYEGLLETIHLLKSPANAARLMRSIEEASLPRPQV